MTRIRWSRFAAAQLDLIYSPKLRSRVYRAVGGLGRFPERGRRPPEVERFPDLDLPRDLRELVFPKVLRVFYQYDSKYDMVRVLGMSFRGQGVGADWLGDLLKQ